MDNENNDGNLCGISCMSSCGLLNSNDMFLGLGGLLDVTKDLNCVKVSQETKNNFNVKTFSPTSLNSCCHRNLEMKNLKTSGTSEKLSKSQAAKVTSNEKHLKQLVYSDNHAMTLSSKIYFGTHLQLNECNITVDGLEKQKCSNSSISWNFLQEKELSLNNQTCLESYSSLSNQEDLGSSMLPSKINKCHDAALPVSCNHYATWCFAFEQKIITECAEVESNKGGGNKNLDSKIQTNYSQVNDLDKILYETCNLCKTEKCLNNESCASRKPKSHRKRTFSPALMGDSGLLDSEEVYLSDYRNKKYRMNCLPDVANSVGDIGRDNSVNILEGHKKEGCCVFDETESNIKVKYDKHTLKVTDKMEGDNMEGKKTVTKEGFINEEHKKENEPLIVNVNCMLRNCSSSVLPKVGKELSEACHSELISEVKAEPLTQTSLEKLQLKKRRQSQQSQQSFSDKKIMRKQCSVDHNWLVGDLLWAKMAGHPWWPCILSYDPCSGHCINSLCVGKVVRTKYHVMFFGEKSFRAWIPERAILIYEGIAAFENFCSLMLKTDLLHQPRSYYQVKDCRRKAWSAAVEEAEHASKMSRKDRLQRYIQISDVDLDKKHDSISVYLHHERMRETLKPKKQKCLKHADVKSSKVDWHKKNIHTNAGNELPGLDAKKLHSGGRNMQKGSVCMTCENVIDKDSGLSCDGLCLGNFHLKCLGLAIAPTVPFICDECVTGIHTCFVCKEASSDCIRCSVSWCGRFYHVQCAQKLRLGWVNKQRLKCSLHMCATCAVDDIKNPLAAKGSLFKCVRCPTAYHQSDLCLSAGSEQLSGNSIICSHHLSKTSQQHVNVNWCFLCSKGGALLCCESCPASFHLDCLNLDVPPLGSWQCEECTDGKRPLYGEIVWAKLGNYRWWPGEICHPKKVPESLLDIPHQTGEFPVYFFGTHNYFWAHIGRVFLFQEEDKDSRNYVKNRLKKSFSRAVQEASAAMRLRIEEKEKREERLKAKIDQKPPPYKHLKASVAIGNVPAHRFNLNDIHPCSCHLNMSDPCGPESKCLNRDLCNECHPDFCPVGNRCQNQRFQQRQYLSVIPFKTTDRGWGLKTLVDIKEGQFVIEYVGELINLEESRQRMKEVQSSKNHSFYLLTLDKDRIIDAGPKGNVSRFMNHSCQPNCETQKWMVNGDLRIGLFSITDIPAGSELTFNYNFDCLGNEKLVCRCGSTICSGFLGLRPKTAMPVTAGNSCSGKKRCISKQLKLKRIHEDECFRCRKPGYLIMCDKALCPKVYHLQCLNMTKPPYGKWICPWHHCDECGRLSTQQCVECDNSFCDLHAEENITQMSSGLLICSDHDELKRLENLSYVCSIENGMPEKDSGFLKGQNLMSSFMEERESGNDEMFAGKLEMEDSRIELKRKQKKTMIVSKGNGKNRYKVKMQHKKIPNDSSNSPFNSKDILKKESKQLLTDLIRGVENLQDVAVASKKKRINSRRTKKIFKSYEKQAKLSRFSKRNLAFSECLKKKSKEAKTLHDKCTEFSTRLSKKNFRKALRVTSDIKNQSRNNVLNSWEDNMQVKENFRENLSPRKNQMQVKSKAKRNNARTVKEDTSKTEVKKSDFDIVKWKSNCLMELQNIEATDCEVENSVKGVDDDNETLGGVTFPLMLGKKHNAVMTQRRIRMVKETKGKTHKKALLVKLNEERLVVKKNEGMTQVQDETDGNEIEKLGPDNRNDNLKL